MVYDIERNEVLMHDVRMQLVDVFRWAYPGGGDSEKWVPYMQGSVFFRSQDWRFPIADRCAGLQLFSFLSGWSPHA